MELSTLLESLIHALREAATYQPGVEEKPVAVLWTDPEGQWQSLTGPLRDRMPELFFLGKWDPENRTGPVPWLKCVLEKVLDDVEVPDGAVPVLYLSGVSRQMLRAGEDCPRQLQPLVELQFRGALWLQRNGKDWTVEAFLVSEDALELDMAQDTATRRSMHAALTVLAVTPLSQLRGKHLEAEDFDKLMVGDPVRDLLTWMNEPAAVWERWDKGKRHAFRSSCKNEFGFDPEEDGETAAGEKLGLHEAKAWQQVWGRFCESPGLYPNLPDLLTRSRPEATDLFSAESWPEENDRAEKRLREELENVADLNPFQAREKLLKLEREHAKRRGWVWLKLGRSVMAQVLEPLAELAKATEKQLGGDSVEEMGQLYEEYGYLADAAALRALKRVNGKSDRKALIGVLCAVYKPWLEAVAERFQKLVNKQTEHRLPDTEAIEIQEGECLLFVDGLRFDLAQDLANRLEARGLRIGRKRRWSALPTVTATAKPAVSPVIDLLGADGIPESFAPSIKATGQELNTDRFKKLLGDAGYQVIDLDDDLRPKAANARAWCETGEIDKRGHKLQADLAQQIPDQLEGVEEVATELLNAGWKKVRIVTDHGWLLMPGGLPKHDLPKYLVESHWARCATIKGESEPDVMVASWHWNASERVGLAPGIRSFKGGLEYAHGGVSLQECLLAVLTIESGGNLGAARIEIREIKWRRLNCRVVVMGGGGLSVDLRSKANVPATSFLSGQQAKKLSGEGKVSLIVEDEDQEGTAAVLVVLDAGGSVVAKRQTVVGGD